MLKMRFLSNPILATASVALLREYCDWLCGERVWGFVVMGPSGAPQSCPTIQIVRGYDFAIRSLQARLMKAGMDFKKALEVASEDADTRCLHFTTIFGMEANSAGCRALTAPGLREIYGNLPSSAPAAVREKGPAAG